MLSLSAGLEGTSYGLDWKANLGRGTSKVTNQDSNYYFAPLWVDATTSGALDPTSGANDPAFVESLKLRPRREGKATVDYLNLQVAGDAFALPAGMLRYAVGLSVLKDELSDNARCRHPGRRRDRQHPAGGGVGVAHLARDLRRTAGAAAEHGGRPAGGAARPLPQLLADQPEGGAEVDADAGVRAARLVHPKASARRC